MKLLKNKTHIYGFEDYNIVSIWDNLFNRNYDYYIPYNYDASAGSYIITKDLPMRVYETTHYDYKYWNTIAFEPTLCENHKELLKTAKKLYVHPSCKLSRSLMAEKYKKSLNPYLSDAVVIPEPNFDEFQLSTDVLFINEKAKIIVKIRFDVEDDTTVTLVKNFQEGDTLRSHITCNITDSSWHRSTINTEDVLDAEFMHCGDVLYIPNSQSYAMDILTHAIPADKIVYEKSVQESLSNETNQLTFDSLISIKDMLDSTDENTVAAGLKSLSMMDWMHYPNSIKYMMSQTSAYKWVYNNASNSTSVKYMLNTISNSTSRRCWPGKYTDKIYEQDYELFKQLKVYYDHVSPDKILEYIRMFDFMRVKDGMIVPHLIERAS